MKKECIQIINNNITIGNCIEILVLADQLKISSLEEKATRFINKKKEELKSLNPEIFKDLSKNYSHLILKLLKKL